jgi:hypothetical protein
MDINDRLKAFETEMLALEERHRSWFDIQGVSIKKYYDVMFNGQEHLLFINSDEDMLPWLPEAIREAFDRRFSQ